MIEHYQGKEGRVVLLNALRNQFLVDGNSEIADLLASWIVVKEFAPGAEILVEGERGGDLYLIFSGQVSIRKHNQEIGACGVGMHVGEIALLEPFKGHTATVVAVNKVIAAKISHLKFADIARLQPNLWRRMALELAHRLVKTQETM